MSGEEQQQIGARLAANGWRTGSVLTPEHARQIADNIQRSAQQPHELQPGERVIVVSQTCDIVVPRLHTEPFVEVLIAIERNGIEGDKANLRSTRHLSFYSKAGGTVLEAHAANRYWIPRQLFDGHHPDAARSLDEAATRKVCEWLGLRYTRPAWPNSLVRRLPPRAQIEQVLREVSEAVAEIRVGITDIDKELPDGVPYKLAVYAVMDVDEYNSSPHQRERCTKAFVRFLELLRKCEGIVVLPDSDVVPGNDFSWQMIQMTERWNLANLTESARP